MDIFCLFLNLDFSAYSKLNNAVESIFPPSTSNDLLYIRPPPPTPQKNRIQEHRIGYLEATYVNWTMEVRKIKNEIKGAKNIEINVILYLI